MTTLEEIWQMDDKYIEKILLKNKIKISKKSVKNKIKLSYLYRDSLISKTEIKYIEDPNFENNFKSMNTVEESKSIFNFFKDHDEVVKKIFKRNTKSIKKEGDLILDYNFYLLNNLIKHYNLKGKS